MKRLLLVLLSVICTAALCSCANSTVGEGSINPPPAVSNTDGLDGNLLNRRPYGVFLSIDSTEIAKLADYDTVVIDAQYFTDDDIDTLHENGHMVFSYINVGSVEDFRNYYNRFKRLFLGKYENWEEEQWVDASDAEWREFIVSDLGRQLVEKGIDGFFVDNLDVYYVHPDEAIFLGLADIMRGLMNFNVEVTINSGDAFANEYLERYGSIDGVFTGINQECVFSAIDFETDRLIVQTPENSKYYQDYITRYAELGVDIYLLEYTTDAKLHETISRYCIEHDFKYYCSGSVELD